MDLGLQDKVVIVGGASKGIGRAAALGFAREGAKVTIAARDPDQLNATAAEIRQGHRRGHSGRAERPGTSRGNRPGGG